MSKGETSILATQNPKLHEQAVIEFEAGKKYKNEFLTRRKENNTFTVLIIEDEKFLEDLLEYDSEAFEKFDRLRTLSE